MSNRTPIETANDQYKALQRKGYRNMSREERWRYFMLRDLRGLTYYWRRRNKKRLFNRLKDSIEQTRPHVEKHDAIIQWFDKARPTEATFRAYRAIEGPLDQAGPVPATYGLGPRAGTFMVPQDIFDGDVRAFDGLKDKVEDLYDLVKDQLDLVDPKVPDLGLYEELMAGISTGLDLEPHDEYNARDDGCLWFHNADTGLDHFFRLDHLVNTVHVTDKVYIHPKPHATWREQPMISLNRAAASLGSSGFGDLPDIMRPLRDYSGMYQRVKWYVRNLNESEPAPEGFSNF